MKYKNIKLAFGIGMTLALMGAATLTALADDATNGVLSPDQIFKKAAESYASLISYSDKGQIVTAAEGTTRTLIFATRLARPNFYRVEWLPASDPSYVNQTPTIQAVWSSGAGDFWEVGNGPQNGGSPDIALDATSAFSGGASTTVPMTFFNLSLGSALSGSMFEEHQQPDENVGAVDCYVFTKELQGKATTIWIGQQDFLIHQVRTVISAAAMQAAIAQIPNEKPHLAAFAHDFVTTETHFNIVTNTPFSKSDFIPGIPHFAPANDDN